jgi:AraC family transcriptional regulator
MHQAFFTALWEEVCRLRENQREPRTMPELVREYMLRELASPVSLDDLARVASMSKYHFVREYRRLTGTTPMAELRMLRLEEARSLLRTTRLPLKAIAPMVGFADQHHLSRASRKYLGRTPKELRRGA